MDLAFSTSRILGKVVAAKRLCSLLINSFEEERKELRYELHGRPRSVLVAQCESALWVKRAKLRRER